jgi:hypothetical protein
MFNPIDMNIFAEVNYIVLLLVCVISLLLINVSFVVYVFRANSSSKAALSLRKHKSNPQSNSTSSNPQHKTPLLNRLEYFPYRRGDTHLMWMEGDSLKLYYIGLRFDPRIS